MGRSRNDHEQALRDQLERMSHRTTTINRLIDEVSAPLDATARLAMRILQRRGPMRSSELAERAHLSRPVVSRCVTALEQAGLIVSTPDPADGRAALLDISDAGRAHIERTVTASHERIKTITQNFTAAELATLARLLTRLNDSADSVVVEPTRYRMESTPA